MVYLIETTISHTLLKIRYKIKSYLYFSKFRYGEFQYRYHISFSLCYTEIRYIGLFRYIGLTTSMKIELWGFKILFWFYNFKINIIKFDIYLICGIFSFLVYTIIMVHTVIYEIYQYAPEILCYMKIHTVTLPKITVHWKYRNRYFSQSLTKQNHKNLPCHYLNFGPKIILHPSHKHQFIYDLKQ